MAILCTARQSSVHNDGLEHCTVCNAVGAQAVHSGRSDCAGHHVRRVDTGVRTHKPWMQQTPRHESL